MRNSHEVFRSDNLKEIDSLEDLPVDEIILINRVGGCGLDSSGSGQCKLFWSVLNTVPNRKIPSSARNKPNTKANGSC